LRVQGIKGSGKKREERGNRVCCELGGPACLCCLTFVSELSFPIT
jgi:hypothetical protein